MSEHKGILVFCEVENGKLTSLATEMLGGGSRLSLASGGELSAVLIGGNISGLAAEAIAFGAQKVYVVEDPALKDYSIEPYLIAIEKVIKQVIPQIILLGQTAAGRDLAPWLAFRLDSAATMDCLALEIDSTTQRMLMTRPVYGGNAQAVQVCEVDPQIATVRSKALVALARDNSRQGQVINIAAGIDPAEVKTRVLERKIQATAGVKLEDARVVVAGGRGIGGVAGFEQLEEVARLLKGAVGATRPPCDNKWIADSRQIGLTGKVVSPDLYIAVGLSGASQHLSGFSSAKVVVAINKDPEANIFKVAKYGIVADWKAVLPAFAASLKVAV
ncbi:MAG TPA: electron transfer flavoprotein subunit alpha/FixB family protein [Dehalococcoidales bacterium]